MEAAEWAEPEFQSGTEAGVSSFTSGDTPEVMTQIYTEGVNLVLLRRTLLPGVADDCQQLADQYPDFNLRSVIRPEQAAVSLSALIPGQDQHGAFIEDLAQVVDMYACLFDLEEVGLRLQVLNRAMCPRFHTDKLGCRLVTTYLGQGTEWLGNNDLDRRKLGRGSQGLSDEESGLYHGPERIQQAEPGDLLLLKGEGWFGNEGQGAVHRSPAVPSGQSRLVVTLDFA